MALDATVGSSTANSYVSQATANSYLTTERLYDSVWVAAVSADRDRALIWSTFLLDVSFDWDGSKMTLVQALRWPRAGATDSDGYNIAATVIPPILEKAVSTLALYLLSQDRIIEPSLIGLGISDAKVGPIQVKIDPEQTKDLIPDDIRIMLETIGSLKGGTTHGGQVLTLKRG